MRRSTLEDLRAQSFAALEIMPKSMTSGDRFETGERFHSIHFLVEPNLRPMHNHAETWSIVWPSYHDALVWAARGKQNKRETSALA